MKLEDLRLLVEAAKKGSYAAVTFNKATIDTILEYMKENNIPRPLAAEKLHTTLLYSRRHLPDYNPQGKIAPAWIGTPTEFVVWETRGKFRDEPTKNCLVLKYKCKELTARHEELMKEHPATYDFPTYEAHITFSYDIGDLDIKTLPSIEKYLSEIVIVNEYGEDLDLDFAKKNS